MTQKMNVVQGKDIPNTPNMPAMSERDRVQIPGIMIPSFRTQIAINRNVHKNIIFNTYGGLGDQICAEPTLRYAFKSFKGLDISLAGEQPQLFSHLPFKKVFDLKEAHPIWENYLTFNTIHSPEHLQWEFMSHMIINCVDYVSLCALRSQLPIADRNVIIKTEPISREKFPQLYHLFENKKPVVTIHAGRHWPIKTFPKDWWDSVLSGLIKEGFTPILIGADTDDNRGTVDVLPHGCLDMRNKMSIMETISLLQRNTDVLVTNDSSPLHMAVTGNAWVGYVATCKHPDHLSHWRNVNGKNEWSWRMENLGLGGIWDVVDHCPNKENEVKVDQIEESLLRSWLPSPKSVVEWTLKRLS